MVRTVTFGEIDYAYGVVTLLSTERAKFVIHNLPDFKKKLSTAFA